MTYSTRIASPNSTPLSTGAVTLPKVNLFLRKVELELKLAGSLSTHDPFRFE